MEELPTTCTCTNLQCPLHPTRHDKGCTPCIAKNLRLNEVPNCFFNKLKGAERRQGDSFADFARCVQDLAQEEQSVAAQPKA